MESHNLGHTPIRNYQRDKKQCLDLMVEFFVLDVSNQESSEPSLSNKSDLSKESKKQLGNDDAFDYLNFITIIIKIVSFKKNL